MTTAIAFKDLQKLVSNSQQEKTRKELFERLRDKPFWIWDKQQHKQEDIRTDGDCCFNHIIGLPQKDGNDKPLYDYEQIIFDSLVTLNGSKYLDKESNRSWYFRVNAQIHGLALYERQCVIRFTNVHCHRA